MIFTEQIDDIAERAAAVVVSPDVYARLSFDEIKRPIDLHPARALARGEWFIVDAKGDILRMHGDRQRVVDVCLAMRAMGVI